MKTSRTEKAGGKSGCERNVTKRQLPNAERQEQQNKGNMEGNQKNSRMFSH